MSQWDELVRFQEEQTKAARPLRERHSGVLCRLQNAEGDLGRAFQGFSRGITETTRMEQEGAPRADIEVHVEKIKKDLQSALVAFAATTPAP